ncbi:hypothetical protein SASPL_135236 [Salvia splendens]|uniref:hAT-like transposase RNase-H fold domain-containing protein n=1 Tax=Salvia splendens TaxID=180675 RepID=A0A8X8WZR6_SALSN|nr:hypothetical protein SASPL_135236 [Salvia splendens]
MWTIWKDLPASYSKEFTDHDFLNSAFMFYDEEKNLVRVTVADALDHKKMGYEYEHNHIPWIDYRPQQKLVPANFESLSKKAQTAKKLFPLKALNNTVRVIFDGFINDEDDEPEEVDRAEYAGSYTQLPHRVKAKQSTGNLYLNLKELYENINIADDDDSVVVTIVPTINGDAVNIGGVRKMGMAVTDDQFHGLAVDDSVIDRKLTERLLKTSSFQSLFEMKPNFGDLSAMFLIHDGKLRVKDNVIDPKTCRDWMIKNSRSHDEVVKSMSLKMQSKFEKYWEEYSDILSMGAVFDPRMKLKLVEYCYSTLDPLSSEDKVNRLKMKLYILYDEYKKKSDDASLSKVSQPNGSCNSEVGESEFMEGVRRQEVGKLKMNPNVFVAYRSYRVEDEDFEDEEEEAHDQGKASKIIDVQE